MSKQTNLYTPRYCTQTHTYTYPHTHTRTHRNYIQWLNEKEEAHEIVNAHIHIHTPIQACTNENLPPFDPKGRKNESERE